MLDVVYRYGNPPDERVVRSLDKVREVYGIRRIVFDEKEKSVRVEFDASRLTNAIVANLLRGAGMDLREQVQLV